MRILSWNINGIRTLPQYHPWNTLKTGEAILNELKADIICFQEMKTQRTAIEGHIAVPGRFDSFLSFPVAKGGYSGVAVYTDTDTVAPLKAEEGLTGMLQPKPPFASEERISPSYPQVHEMELFPDENEETPSSLAALDAEGRALVVDFGLFVLINVYCPAETSETRLPYKMNFHLMLEERVRKLIHEEGREVIVVGDINISAAPIDHCDGHLSSVQVNFWGHPPRAWLKKWLAPSGPMVDVIRETWPERTGMYTCWNTKISARDSNYGMRIDYIFLSRALLPWFKHGDIEASVRGSDHCPIYIDLHDEIRLESGEMLSIQDAMKFEEAKRKPPRVSTRFWNEFSGKQQLLSTFFTKKSAHALPSSSTPATSSQETVPPIQSTQESVTDVPSSQPEQLEEPSSIVTPTSSQNLTSTGKTPPSSNNASPDRKTSISKKKKRDEEVRSGEPKKKKRKVGQTTLSSFFAKPPRAASSSKPSTSQSRSEPAVIDVDKDDKEGTPPPEESSQIEADYILARSLSGSTELFAPRAPSSSQSKAAWSQLLAPLQPPKCKVHEEPCKEFTVNKAGPNKGKTFYICSRPVGPGYDKGRSERLREEVDRQYRCDFFKWANEVKKASMKEARKEVLDSSSQSGSKSGGTETTGRSPSQGS